MQSKNPFDRIFEKLSFRKLYHFVGGVLIFSIVYLCDGLLIYLFGLTYLAIFWFWGKRISFAVMAVLILYAITQSKFATLGAVIVFTIGDGMAALIGSAFGKSKWPWHRHKTILGTITFFITSVIALGLYIPFVLSGSRFTQGIIILIPAFIASFLECLPLAIIRDRKPDDNLILILSSGLLFYSLQSLFQLQTLI